MNPAFKSGSADVGLWTDSRLKSYIEQTSSDISNTWRDVADWWEGTDAALHQKNLNAYNGWREFLAKWSAYRQDALDHWFGTVAIAESVDEFRTRHKQWRDIFSRLGVQFKSPDPLPPQQDRPGVINKVIIAIAIAGGSYVAVEALKAYRGK